MTPMTDTHMKPLHGKTVIVTGSTGGIGLGIAEALSQQGASVMLNGFGDAAQIEATRARLEQGSGVAVRYSSADMSKPSQIRELAEQARAELGPIDILVNNAGVQHVEPVETFPDDKWDLILAVDLTSAFHLIKAVLPQMKARGWGRIVNIASAHGLVGSPFKSAYVAAKHGLVGLTKVVALEAAEAGVTCNAICPGYVLTPLVERQIPEQAKARGLSEEQVVRDVLLHAQSTKRFVTVAEVAAFTGFLCSEGAASITGAALPIEGGWTAH